jgi:DNA-directed RNA polymerase subunit RPC12/RpoP
MPQMPDWAPRISQEKIRKLYELDAKGIADDDLIDEVGFALLARCDSFVAAVNAVHGKAVCPSCGQVVEHSKGKEEELTCDNCGWKVLWKDYFKTIQHKQLSGAEHVLELFQDYVDQFSVAKQPKEKMVLIDQLIHGFHWYLALGNTRPVAVNLIKGRLTDVIAFLDDLSYGENSSPGLRENYDEWLEESAAPRNRLRRISKP